MAAEERMTVDERRRYLKRMHGRYWAQDRKGRSALLDEIVAYTGLHRKYVIELLRSDSLDRKPRKAKRSRTYGADVEHAVCVVWESLDYVCAERLTASLLPTALHLAKFGELEVTDKLREQLGRISVSTVGRMIKRLPRQTWRLPRRGPAQVNQVRKNVPMVRLSWSITEPGYFETDLVHHCGERAAGDYAHTLQLIDVATAWSERVGLLGRSQYAMEIAFRRAQNRLPFDIKGLHPDSGSEFFNNHLVRIWGEEITGLQLTRSRPYEKNDNRFVEQKNSTLVRAYLGNYRIDTPIQVEHMNELYDMMWLYYNFFQPVFRLASKQIVNDRVRRKWDTPQTPYARLLATGVLDDATREKLDLLVQSTNPRALRRDIYKSIERLWDEPSQAVDQRHSA